MWHFIRPVYRYRYICVYLDISASVYILLFDFLSLLKIHIINFKFFQSNSKTTLAKMLIFLKIYIYNF